MSSAFLVALAAVAPLFANVAGHGQIVAVEANGQTYDAPNPYYNGDAKNRNTPVTVNYKSDGKAFLTTSDFGNPSAMSCEGAGVPPGQLTVTAGNSIRVYWAGATNELVGKDGVGPAYGGNNAFVHGIGPDAMDIASCNGPCSSFNPADALWNRIAYEGFNTGESISGALRQALKDKPEPYYPQGNGLWGLAALIARGSYADAIIPSELAPGEYLVRSELAALHSPGAPQLYVGCVSVKVEGSGTKTLTGGTNAANLYNSGGALATIDVYNGNINFDRDGPALLDFASQTPVNNGGNGGSDNGGGSGDSGSDDSTPEGENDDDDDKDEGPANNDSEPTTAEDSEPAATVTETPAAEESSPASSCRRRRRSIKKRAPSAHKRAAFPHVHGSH